MTDVPTILTRTGVPDAFRGAAIDPAFQQSKVDPADISAGIGAAFGVMSIRGKVFRIKFRGEEYPVVTPGTNHPAPNIDVVMVKASQAISKIWYEQTFVEGNREAPDCFSTNGVSPDASSAKKQAQFCATCPQNMWGSKTVNGKALKACQDTKRVAVVPLGDLRNEAFGGPMLLRVPPASLQDLSHYSDLMLQWGQTYYSVGTQITFDIDVAHPQLKFAPMMPLTGDQARIIVELQDHPQVKRMLSEAVEYARAEEPKADAPPPPPTVATASAPPAPPPPTPPQTAQQAYVPPVVATTPPAPNVGTPAQVPTSGVLPTGQQDDLAIPQFLKRQEPAVVPGVGVTPGRDAAPPQPEVPYQFTPDGQFRWRPGMAAWEPVPVVLAAPAAPAPLAVATIAQPTPPASNGQALTPEQQRILDLEAQLAAAKAPKSRKKATPPPSPAPTAVEPGTQIQQAATPPPAPPSTPAAPAGFSVSTSAQTGSPATSAAPTVAGVDPNKRLDGLLTTILPGSKPA